jgi:hypothetical protein
MLRYGKGNNFYKFRSALSDVATEKFGNLGKLIDLEEYYAKRKTTGKRGQQGDLVGRFAKLTCTQPVSQSEKRE